MPIEILPGSYCGAPPAPDLALQSWNFDPPLLLGLMLLLVVLRHERTGPVAVGVLALAFVSPLCAISVGLFSARVVHHVLLVAVAAPLLAAALPARRPSGVALPFLVSTALLWAWHLPTAYDLALRDMAVYWIMQATLLGSAVWFWRSVLSTRAGIDAVLWSLAGLMQMGALGALLTFAPVPLYAAHGLAPLAWGLTPLADQQLGGLIMWVPAMLPYAAMIALSARRGWRASGGRSVA
ncbi:cytochrome c oxidase assembly protein [Tateyamaria sp. syn59]|uniref:cytochrome c oxidase assembly protein n=1 Tax=Tateyamaria sp. syn59 TaxID=2576942 RepID=UPI00167539D7|nr:cytochrome c oxidase assembly protein [Tateyamaria sp. syn59]